MKRALTTLVVALALVTPTHADPPTAGTTHTFHDPVFIGTVFCDSYFEVLAIATADDPQAVFASFHSDRNEIDEPVCAVIAPTGTVVDVRSLGIMQRDGRSYDAWAVETRVGEHTGFALYVEPRLDIRV